MVPDVCESRVSPLLVLGDAGVFDAAALTIVTFCRIVPPSLVRVTIIAALSCLSIYRRLH